MGMQEGATGSGTGMWQGDTGRGWRRQVGTAQRQQQRGPGDPVPRAVLPWLVASTRSIPSRDAAGETEAGSWDCPIVRVGGGFNMHRVPLQ